MVILVQGGTNDRNLAKGWFYYILYYIKSAFSFYANSVRV